MIQKKNVHVHGEKTIIWWKVIALKMEFKKEENVR